MIEHFECLGDPRPRKKLRSYHRRRQQEAPEFLCSQAVGGRVLLLDDVVTSGRTLRAARQALLAAGADEVATAALAGV